MNHILSGLLCLALFSSVSAQTTISGTVIGMNADRSSESLPYANVILPVSGTGTATDAHGDFQLSPTDDDTILVTRYVGYTSDTQRLDGRSSYYIVLRQSVLDEVEVTGKQFEHSLMAETNTVTLDREALGKMACCNLSESFENSGAVEVRFSDAVTGAKHITMLGLDGRYTQILFEQLPSVRGLKNAYGLMHVPGPWMSSISVNRGAGSVTNGYDGITGQIVYQYRKPIDDERFFMNLFATRHGQYEANAVWNQDVGDVAASGLLVHASGQRVRHDANGDGFQDIPVFNRLSAMNRWYIVPGPRVSSQIGVSYSYDERSSGQVAALHGEADASTAFRADVLDRSIEAFGKTGFRFTGGRDRSLGIQYRYQRNDLRGWYSGRTYAGLENMASINTIFMTGLADSAHSIKVGGSLVYDDLDERVDSMQTGFREIVPGIFTEYTFSPSDKLALVLGLRGDYSTRFGLYGSPRLHLRWNPTRDLVVRLSGGHGYRTPFILAENMRLFASSRTIVMDDDLGNDQAWNAGLNLVQEFKLGFVPGALSLDVYTTHFTNQVVADYEAPRTVRFYDLDGRSFSNSVQAGFRVEPVEGLDLSLDYKYDDVRTTYRDLGLARVPYVPTHTGLLNVQYQTPDERFDISWTGKLHGWSRLPSTEANPATYRRPDRSPAWFTMNAQVGYRHDVWEGYLGGENLSNYWQDQPIRAAHAARGSFFDASMIWGPLGGTRIYAGFNLNIMPRPDERTGHDADDSIL